MKYSDLISFNPIEDVIQLVTADDSNKAREYVKTYIMSDAMVQSLKSPVLEQLQMDEVVDNKGVLVVGNYGTGKSHLMSVISAIAKDADNLQYLQNKKFAEEMECIAGKFEVLRIEIGGTRMSLYDVIMGYVQDDFDERGIDFDVPEYNSVRSPKAVVKDMMAAFSAKYPDKGYLIVVDLSENKNTCFDIQYNGQKRQMIEVLRGRYNRDMDFKDTVDLAASLCLDEYFCGKYPDYPTMKTKVTRKNIAENVRQAFDYFAGRKTQTATLMLQSFGVLNGDKIRPEGSKYAAYYIDQLKQLPPQGVINYSDIFDVKYDDQYEDKHFKINYLFTPIIFLSMVYAGYATMTLRNGTVLSASNLDTVPRIGALDLYDFKYLARPAQMAMAELKKLFDVLEINPALLDNPNDRDEGVKQLLKKAQETSNSAVLVNQKLNNGFELWNEPLVDAQHLIAMQKACAAVKDEFSNYSARFNTPAKLNNFTLTFDEIDKLAEQIALIKAIAEYVTFKTDCANNVSYLSNIEFIDLGANFKQKLEAAKDEFRSARDSILTGTSGDAAAQKVNAALEKVKEEYIGIYFEEHKKKRLDIDDAKRRGKLQESLALTNLRKLRGVEILSAAKLTKIEQDMANLKVCYELTPTELKTTHICPHCGYHLGDPVPNVAGQLDNLDIRIDDLVTEWTQTLLNTISDPIVASQKEYLSAEQQKAIDDFIASGTLPKRVDDFFIKAIQALLKGFEPVVVDAKDLMDKLTKLPPMDEATFKLKLNELIAGYTKGKDEGKLRIIVK